MKNISSKSSESNTCNKSDDGLKLDEPFYSLSYGEAQEITNSPTSTTHNFNQI